MAEPPSTRDLRPGLAGAAAAPRPGELFAARYHVDAELGRGGFGAVYAARDTVLDRPVALKVLARGAHDPETLARFLQEARSAAALASEHVVSVHDIVVGDDGVAFLVMELLRGADLHDELADHGPLPVASAVDRSRSPPARAARDRRRAGRRRARSADRARASPGDGPRAGDPRPGCRCGCRDPRS